MNDNKMNNQALLYINQSSKFGEDSYNKFLDCFAQIGPNAQSEVHQLYVFLQIVDFGKKEFVNTAVNWNALSKFRRHKKLQKV